MKQFTPSNIAKVFALTSVSTLSVLSIAPAHAIVMNFESLAENNNQSNYVGADEKEAQTC
jgi:hypothetical protein